MSARKSTAKAKPRAKAAPPTPPPPKRAATLHARYILALLLEGRNDQYIHAALDADDLPCPSDEELDGLRAEFVPKGFKPTTKGAAVALKRLGLAEYFAKKPVAQEALVLLRQPRQRELVEAGLIVGVPTAAIAQTVRRYLKREASVAAIETYRLLYFDTSGATRSQLRVVVHARVRLAVTRAVGDTGDEVAARRAISGDARMVAVGMVASPMAWRLVMMACGFSPGRCEIADVIESLESTAVVRASEALLRGEADDERRASAYVDVLAKLQQIRASVQTPEVEVAKKLNAFRLVHSVAKLPTISELAGGTANYTVDVSPPSPAVEEDAVVGSDAVPSPAAE